MTPRPRFPRTGLTLLPLTLLLSFACTGESTPPISATPRSAEVRPASTPPRAAPVDAAAEAYQAGLQALLRGEQEAAVASYRRAIELDPDHAAAHFALGRALVPTSYVMATGARDFTILDEGIEHLLQAARLDPEDADRAYWHGRALDLRGHDDDALAALRHAIELDPEHGLAHKRLGLLYTDRGDFEQAKQSFQRAMELLPDDPGASFQYGNLVFEEDPQGARTFYERTIEIDPTFPWVYEKLAQVLARLGDDEGALSAEKKFKIWKRYDDQTKVAARRAGEKPEDPALQIAAGERYFAARHWDKALSLFRRALALDPSDPLVHLYCGKTMLELEEYEVAMNHLEEASFLAPDELVPKLELIRLYVVTGNEFVVTELIKGIETGPWAEDSAARVELADLLLDLGRRADAARQYAAVLALDPENVEARDGLVRSEDEEQG